MRSSQLVATAMLLSVLLSGCGGEDAIESVRDQPNSFPPAKNPITDFSDNSTGDSSNTIGLADNEVRITVEVPGRLAPNGELTRRNLRIVRPDRVRVYRTNNSLQELSSVNTRQRREGNRVVITFVDGRPLGPDVVIDVSVGNTHIRSLASDADRDVKVNPYSEYLVRNAVGNYTPAEFTQLMDCVNSNSDNLCLNKYVWSALADQVQDFEIDIPTGEDLAGAIQFLGRQADFSHYVESMADYALLDSESSGKITAQSAGYNSVFLGIELGQSFLVSDASEPGQWGVRIAQEKFLEDDFGTAYVYPGLTLTSFDLFNISVTSLANDIPYERTTVAQTGVNDFFERSSDYWALNTQSTAPGAATLEDNTQLLAGRSLYQSITGQNSARTIGWTRNPYFLDAFVGGGFEAPDRVLNGYFSAGKAIQLQLQGQELKRERTLENHYLSALEVNLARSDDFDLGRLSDRDYNVVTFATLLGSTGEPVRYEAGAGQWRISGQTITQTLSDTLTVSRDEDGTVTSSTVDRSGQRNVSHRTATLSDGDRNIGRLNLDLTNPPLDGGKPDLGVGASTPDGSLLSFNLDNFDTGDGLLIAAAQASGAPVSGNYRLQGLTMAMASGINRLSHYQDATLTINSGSNATLVPKGLAVVHDVSDEQVQPPTALAESAIDLAYGSPGDGQITFVSANLRFDGFVTGDQGQIFLRVSDLIAEEKTLGLVMATLLP